MFINGKNNAIKNFKSASGNVRSTSTNGTDNIKPALLKVPHLAMSVSSGKVSKREIPVEQSVDTANENALASVNDKWDDFFMKEAETRKVEKTKSENMPKPQSPNSPHLAQSLIEGEKNLSQIIEEVEPKQAEYVEHGKSTVYANGFSVENASSFTGKFLSPSLIHLKPRFQWQSGLESTSSENVNQDYKEVFSIHFLPTLKNGEIAEKPSQVPAEERNKIKLDFIIGLLSFLKQVREGKANQQKTDFLRVQTNPSFLGFLVKNFGFHNIKGVGAINVSELLDLELQIKEYANVLIQTEKQTIQQKNNSNV